MNRTRRCRSAALLLVAAATVTACADETPGTGVNRPQKAPVTTSTSSAPFTGTTVAVGEVLRLENLDGARLQQVDDGLVRSFEMSVEVTEIGWADQVGSDDDAYRAEGDATLVVFSMTTEYTERETPLEGEVVATVTVDDQQRELPDFASDSDDGETVNYAVAVPEDRRSVSLELKYGGVEQSFDLLEGKPTGERPEALYRATSGTVVYQEGLTPAQFDVDAYGQGFTETYTVTVGRAELGYFPLQGSETPSGEDKGWLTMLVGSDSSATTCSAPLSAYTFTDDKGTVYQAAQPVSEIPDPGIIDVPVAVVTFEVPADLSKGTLTVTSPQVTCQVSTATYKQVPARGAATIDVALPEN